MSVIPSTSATAAPTDPVAAATQNQLNGNDFLTLLVAQLKNQDPTSPMDPTQFVTQLVQFNSLEQLIGIKQDMDTATASATPSATPNNSGTTNANNPNSTTTTAQ